MRLPFLCLTMFASLVLAGSCAGLGSAEAGSTSGAGADVGSGAGGGADAGSGAVSSGSGGATDGGGGFPTPPCADETDGAVDGGFSGCAMAKPGLTYDADILPIVVKNCSGELCHTAPTYDELVNVAAYQCCDMRMIVAPGDPGHSYLMNKLTGLGLCAGGSMPLDMPLLPDAEIQTIHDWICDGAPQQ